MACWSTKAAISLKRVKIEEKLLWRPYRNPPTPFRTVPFPTPTASSSQDWGSQPQSKTAMALLSQARVKLRTSNFAASLTGSIRTKAHWEKGASIGYGTVHFFGVPPIISVRTSNFVGYAHYYYRSEQKPITNFGKSSRGRTHGLSKIFRAQMYWAHRAVIFAIAQLSCLFIHMSADSSYLPHIAYGIRIVAVNINISWLLYPVFPTSYIHSQAIKLSPFDDASREKTLKKN